MSPASAAPSSSSDTTNVDIDANLQDVRTKIESACHACNRDPKEVRLVAVSKTKPLELVKMAYDAGQRVFGENYAQELVEKAQAMKHDNKDGTICQWHFIGGLQSNKANMLVKGVVPYGKLVVETVNTIKVANKLDSAMSDVVLALENDDDTTKLELLEVFVQINTSGEDSKSGIAIGDRDAIVGLCHHIVNECEHLTLKGIMTIGAPGDVTCLDQLVECRTLVAESLGLEDPQQLELSMGMSGDFEVAIAKGSTNVRVGSTVFGARDYSNLK